MRSRNDGGLPGFGFFEMKQDVYDTARRLQNLDIQRQKRIAFCRQYIPFLQMIENDEDLKNACKEHSVYAADKEHPALISYLYEHFMQEAYDAGVVIPNYGELVAENRIKKWVKEPIIEQLEKMDAEHVLACIAWHFRRDHFVEGSLISDSIADGHMLRMLKIYAEKERIRYM